MRTNKAKQILLGSLIVMSCSFLRSEEIRVEEARVESGHTINFYDVPIVEVIRFVSRISAVNFIFNNRELEFNVTLSSGKPVSSENVLRALLQMLKTRGFGVTREDNYYVIHQPGGEGGEGHATP
ncbi:MAG: hypothetical protein ACHQT8_05710, partial [Chlamydiales bacterium]